MKGQLDNPSLYKTWESLSCQHPFSVSGPASMEMLWQMQLYISCIISNRFRVSCHSCKLQFINILHLTKKISSWYLLLSIFLSYLYRKSSTLQNTWSSQTTALQKHFLLSRLITSLSCSAKPTDNKDESLNFTSFIKCHFRVQIKQLIDLVQEQWRNSWLESGPNCGKTQYLFIKLCEIWFLLCCVNFQL